MINLIKHINRNTWCSNSNNSGDRNEYAVCIGTSVQWCVSVCSGSSERFWIKSRIRVRTRSNIWPLVSNFPFRDTSQTTRRNAADQRRH